MRLLAASGKDPDGQRQSRVVFYNLIESATGRTLAEDVQESMTVSGIWAVGQRLHQRAMVWQVAVATLACVVGAGPVIALAAVLAIAVANCVASVLLSRHAQAVLYEACVRHRLGQPQDAQGDEDEEDAQGAQGAGGISK